MASSAVAGEDVEVGSSRVCPAEPLSKPWKSPGDQKVDFRFRDVRFSVEVSKMKASLMGGEAGVKHILGGVSGAVESGQILAIIGSSGAGKTSLLDVLVGKVSAGTKGLDITGDVTVNGKAMSKSFFLENAAYVPQEDRLWSALTVRENLTFACKMYSPALSRADSDKRVNKVLASLGLEGCQHTKVGNVFLKGISGGQKRRTSIGVELVVQRKILFLDEPTSGLDAASASEIMSLLRRLASETDVIIIASVHQPSSRVFNSFDQPLDTDVAGTVLRQDALVESEYQRERRQADEMTPRHCGTLPCFPLSLAPSTTTPIPRFSQHYTVILLTMGQTAYFGPASDSLDHFARLGHEPKGLVNPADYLLEITNADFSDTEAVQELADSWKETPGCRALNARLEAPLPPPLEEGSKAGYLAALLQLRTLIVRASMNSVRDPAAYALRYYQVENTQEDILNRVFLILWINAFNSYMDMAAIPVFELEKEAVVKEVQNGQYGVAGFCIANAVVQVPFVLLIALCCITPVYWITDMNDDPLRYLQFILLMFLMLFVIESLAQLVGVIVKNFVLGIAVFASCLSMFFIFNGFFIDPINMPDFWLWLYWISPLRYSWEAMAQIVFEGQTYAGMDTCVTCYGTTGAEVLDSLSNGGTNLNDVSIAAWCGALVGLSVVWRLIHYVALKRSIF
ncbi:conserved unknown protein [Ectocarpus siliculosus]|uniref:ABC transporter domain-containing protein n=1 Tax=Ectocarpus siliculosus TaxID=2880 RepID=D7G2U6_ECTSI|nr:conserved unknown protein [Ectocarpus siliculosus]|eukprot:CBJ33450.1 conserved unknown protein [Ectocarpus siliculosus]